MARDTDGRLPTNLRTLLLIEAIGQENEAMSPAELGRRVGLPKQTIHRLCNVLRAEGFLVTDERGKGLRPGRRTRELATGLLYGSSTHFIRRQVLEALADEIGETVNFVVPDDKGMAYLDRVETDWAFRIQLPIGSLVPFHCTASGKAYLATIPKPERRRLAGVMAMPSLTPKTIVDAEAMLAELQTISRQGYAVDNEEFHLGMIAAAVPVRDPNGRYFASLAFHAPIQRVPLERVHELAPILKNSARMLTEALFQD